MPKVRKSKVLLHFHAMKQALDQTQAEKTAHAIGVEDLAAEAGMTVKQVFALAGEEDILTLAGGRRAVTSLGARRVMSKAGRRFPFRVVAHSNLKGGIGKTTSALALASRAAQLGYRVALLDLDPQASATLASGVHPDSESPLFYDVWSKPGDFLPQSLFPVQAGLDLLPSSLENSLLDTSLLHPSAQKSAVKDSAAVLRQSGYDLVVLDCPPSLGAATISAICAAHHLVIPVGTDAFSFKGLALTLAESEAIRKTFRLKAPEIHVLLARYDRRLTVDREAWQRLQREQGERMVPQPIRSSSLFGRLLADHQSLFASRRKHPARDDYRAFAARILA